MFNLLYVLNVSSGVPGGQESRRPGVQGMSARRSSSSRDRPGAWEAKGSGRLGVQ